MERLLGRVAVGRGLGHSWPVEGRTWVASWKADAWWLGNSKAAGSDTIEVVRLRFYIFFFSQRTASVMSFTDDTS